MRKLILTVIAIGLLIVGVAPALAHVTVQPNTAATGSFSRFVVRVPNEKDASATVKVEVKLPETLAAVSFEPKPGWKRTVERKPLATPIDVEGEKQTEYIATVTWEGGRIEPGEFDEFGFSAKMPDNVGALTFPAVQTYDNGEAVNWIGPKSADEPAPTVTVTKAAAGTDDHAAASSDTNSSDTNSSDDSDSSKTLAWIALGLAVVGLLFSIGALAMSRRRTA
ncbi:MAG: hypothetical protein QOK43_1142 [Acidimicrobiaceae bacterium]|nr:hypothetical protein [Acidimicrobiaceae bacterium]